MEKKGLNGVKRCLDTTKSTCSDIIQIKKSDMKAE